MSAGAKCDAKAKGRPSSAASSRAEEARAEQPDGYAQAGARHCANSLIGRCWFEIGLQFFDVLREIVGSRSNVAAQCAHGGLIGSGSAAESEIDAVWIERGERAELLRDDERANDSAA